VKLTSAHLSSALALAAILCAAFAQRSHTFSNSDVNAIFFFAFALALGAAAIVTRPVAIGTRIDDPPRAVRTGRHISTSLEFSIVAAALLTYFLSNDNEFNSDNVLAWVAGVAIIFYAFWEPQKSWVEWRQWAQARVESARGIGSNGFRVSSRAALLIAIILVGIFFYFHDLDGVPAEMDSDHAEKILDVNDVVDRGLRPIFFERNTGREPLEFYLISMFVELTRHSRRLFSHSRIVRRRGGVRRRRARRDQQMARDDCANGLALSVHTRVHCANVFLFVPRAQEQEP
jgi:hypothetical protein